MKPSNNTYISTDEKYLKQQLPKLREKLKKAESLVPSEGTNFPLGWVMFVLSLAILYTYFYSQWDIYEPGELHWDDDGKIDDFTAMFMSFFGALLGATFVRGLFDGWQVALEKNKEDAMWKAKREVVDISDQIHAIEDEIKTIRFDNNTKKELFLNKESLISKFDVDRNGIIDVVELEDTFSILIKKNQNALIEKEKEFNKSYVHQFVKVGKYLNDKKSNLQLLFEYAKKAQDPCKITQLDKVIQQEIYTLNLLTVNTLDMIVSLLEDDRITFYSLYEKLDELGIFTSNYEKEMLTKLNNINSSIGSLIGEMESMSLSIVNTIEDLSYQTEESTALLTSHLEDINSTMKVGNTLSAINLYQNHKTNKRLKG